MFFYSKLQKKINKLGTNHSCSQPIDMGMCVCKKRNVGSNLETETPCGMYNGQEKIPSWQVWSAWASHGRENKKKTLREKKK